jgi:hypothetical protein
MYKIERIGKNDFYIKIMGLFPPPAARRFSERFLREIEGLDKIRVIIDLLDAILIRIASLEIIINLLKTTEEKLDKSAFCIPSNPPVKEELKYILDQARSPKRKIVKTLDEAKTWTGIPNIIL